MVAAGFSLRRNGTKLGLLHPCLLTHWVDKQRFIPIREERYFRQNKLLKSYSVKEVKKIQNRYFPVASELRDMLRKTTSTELRVVSAKFDLPLNDKLFSRSNLRK